jgi:hypothetical protein
MVAGRSTEGRSVTVTSTTGSAAITAAAGTFEEEDAGRTVTGTGIPAGATLASVTSDTAATLSANATTTGARAVTLGVAAGTSYGFAGWSPESDAESETYSIAGGASASSPDRITSPTMSRPAQRTRG